MGLGLRGEVASSNRRAPLGPPGLAKDVGFNETNCLTIQYKTRYYYSFNISFVFSMKGFAKTQQRLPFLSLGFIATIQLQNVDVSS